MSLKTVRLVPRGGSSRSCGVFAGALTLLALGTEELTWSRPLPALAVSPSNACSPLGRIPARRQRIDQCQRLNDHPFQQQYSTRLLTSPQARRSALSHVDRAPFSAKWRLDVEHRVAYPNCRKALHDSTDTNIHGRLLTSLDQSADGPRLVPDEWCGHFAQPKGFGAGIEEEGQGLRCPRGVGEAVSANR